MTQAGKLPLIAALPLYGIGVLVVVAFLIVSGIANINVWYNSAQGWNAYVFSTIGVGAELWGAVGLIFLTVRSVQRQWLKAFLCLVLWAMAVGFNGYSTYRYFVVQGSDVVAENVTDQAIQTIATDRILELTTSISAIGETRTPEAIIAERDQLPENYRTRRAQLDAELATAQRRATLETDLAEARSDKLQTAAAGQGPDVMAITDWRIITALVIFMELVKAFGMFIMFGRVNRSEKQAMYAANDVPQQEFEADAPTPIHGMRERIRVGPDGTQRRVRVL